MMARKRIAVFAIIGIIIVAGLVMNIGYLTGVFHFEYPSENIEYVGVSLEDLEDAELVITFDNTLQKAYSVDIYCESLGVGWGQLDFRFIGGNQSTIAPRFVFKNQITKVQLVLNPELRNGIVIRNCIDLNTTIIGPSNAYIDFIQYLSTGNLTVILDECNTDRGTLILETSIYDPIDTLKLYVDLPPDFQGWVRLNETGLVTLMDISGWTFDGVDRYTCRSTGELYAMDLRGVNHAYLWLYD